MIDYTVINTKYCWIDTFQMRIIISIDYRNSLSEYSKSESELDVEVRIINVLILLVSFFYFMFV